MWNAIHASMPSYMVHREASAAYVVSDSVRCTIGTRDPFDGQTSTYRCGLASLNDLRI